MFALNGWAADYFAEVLAGDPEGQSVGLAYFRQQRGMTDATIRKFGLGFCPGRGDRMSRDALKAGYREEFLVATGLSLRRESDGSLYDQEGVIESISGVIDPSTGSIQFRAVFPNAGRLLHSGGTGNVILTRTDKDCIVIPRSATFEVQDKVYVYKVVDGKASSSPIEVRKGGNGREYIV